MLGSLLAWVSKEKIFQNLPESFKDEYEDVRGIFDRTEIKCDTPKGYQAKCILNTSFMISTRDLFVFNQMVGLHLCNDK